MSLRFLFPSLEDGAIHKRDSMRKAFSTTTGFAFLLAVITMLALTSASAKEAVPVGEDPEIEKRMTTLSEDLRCLVCQNETIAASRADFANDLRREIREQMQANKSDKEILDFLVARYGDFVLYRPPMKATTLFLWFGPLLLLVIGLGALFYRLSRRRAAAPAALSESERARAAALLAPSDAGEPR